MAKKLNRAQRKEATANFIRKEKGLTNEQLLAEYEVFKPRTDIEGRKKFGQVIEQMRERGLSVPAEEVNKNSRFNVSKREQQEVYQEAHSEELSVEAMSTENLQKAYDSFNRQDPTAMSIEQYERALVRLAELERRQRVADEELLTQTQEEEKAAALNAEKKAQFMQDMNTGLGDLSKEYGNADAYGFHERKAAAEYRASMEEWRVGVKQADFEERFAAAAERQAARREAESQTIKRGQAQPHRWPLFAKIKQHAKKIVAAAVLGVGLAMVALGSGYAYAHLQGPITAPPGNAKTIEITDDEQGERQKQPEQEDTQKIQPDQGDLAGTVYIGETPIEDGSVVKVFYKDGRVYSDRWSEKFNDKTPEEFRKAGAYPRTADFVDGLVRRHLQSTQELGK